MSYDKIPPIDLSEPAAMAESDLSLDPYEAAAKLGLVVKLPEDNQLFVDIDDEVGEKQLRRMLDTLRKNGLVVVIENVVSSRSGGDHKHVYLRVHEGALPGLTMRSTLTPIERVLLQALLGSDLRREALSYLRIRRRLDRPPTTFFEPPENTNEGGRL